MRWNEIAWIEWNMGDSVTKLDKCPIDKSETRGRKFFYKSR